MAMLLDTQTNPEIQTADSRFFIAESGIPMIEGCGDAFSSRHLSRDFSLGCYGLLALRAVGPVTVFQAGISSTGELVDPLDSDSRVTVDQEFTPREVRNWRLTVTSPEIEGRNEFAVDVDLPRAINRHFDHQGSPRSERELGFYQTIGVIVAIHGLLRSKKFSEHIGEKIDRLERMKNEIARYRINNVFSKLHPKKFEKVKALKEKNLAKAGFTPTRPISLEPIELR